MKLNFKLSIMLAAGMYFSSCASQKEMGALQEQLDYYKERSIAADSLAVENDRLGQTINEQQMEYKQVVREMEDLQAANINLKKSFNENLKQLNDIQHANTEAFNTSSSQQLELQQRLSEQEVALDTKQRELALLEYELYQKEERLNLLEAGNSGFSQDLEEKERRIQELEAKMLQNEQQMAQIRTSIDRALSSLSADELAVKEQNGKMYLSLSQELLFSSGSDKLNWKGKKALKQVAEALKEHNDIEITVEGHTDNVGSASSNWDLSVMRATAVVKQLVTYGVEPEKVTASGRGYYQPIAPNTSADERAKNRRTEIILAPKLDELYNLMDNK